MPARLRPLTPAASPWHRFGAKIRELRLDRGWPQGELGLRVAATKSYVSFLETASRHARPDLARRLDVALAASGDVLQLLPETDCDHEPRDLGLVIVAYQGAHGSFALCTSDMALIDSCDEMHARSFARAFTWTIQATRATRSIQPPADATYEVDASRATTRVRAETPEALRHATLRLIAAIQAGADPAGLNTGPVLTPPRRRGYEGGRRSAQSAVREHDVALANAGPIVEHGEATCHVRDRAST